MNNRKNNSKLGLLLLLFLVVFVSIGYASLSSSLNITGTSKVTSETWDIHFANLTGVTKKGDTADSGAEGLSVATINPSDNKQVTFNVSMKKPGDKYSFKVDVVNTGSLPAKANVNVTGLTGEAANWLTWTVTGINADETIAATTGSKTITVTVEFKDVDSLPTSEFTANLVAEVVATQQ